MLIDRNGDLWTGGSGGVVHWDVKTGEYVKYTTEHGLASNYVSSIAQADDGALWFGSCWGGASRFDGVNWTTYTTHDGLLQDCVLSIAITPDGAIWFGFEDGVTRYDGQTWTSFNHVTTRTSLRRADVMAVAPDGALWIGGNLDSGLIRYDGREWQDFSRYLPDHAVTALAFAPDGMLWVGTQRKLSQYFHGEWEDVPIINSLDMGEQTSISSIAFALDGSPWVGFSFDTMSKVGSIEREQSGDRNRLFDGVFHYDGNAWTVVNMGDGLIGNEILAIAMSPNGSVWFGSYNQGVSRFDGKKWETFKTKDDIPSNSIEAVDVSKSGIVWVIQPGCASRNDGRGWMLYSQIGSLPGADTLFIGFDDSIWFGSFYGVARLEGQDWTTFSQEDYEWLTGVNAISATSKGTYLFGSFTNGASEYDGETWKRFSYLGDQGIDSLLAHPDGSLWFGTSHDGVYKYDGKNWQHYTKSNGLVYDSGLVLAVSSDGAVWVGTFKGVSRFDGTRWINYTWEDGLVGIVDDIAIDQKDIVWVGTDTGLFRFDGKTWLGFTSRDGLADNQTSGVTVGPDGAIWIATHGGLSRYMPLAP